MSPAPSPSPTHHQAHRSSTAPLRTPLHGQMMGPPVTPQQPQRPLSGSMSNLSLSGSKKWGSNHDFRDQSPGPNTPITRYYSWRISRERTCRSTILIKVTLESLDKDIWNINLISGLLSHSRERTDINRLKYEEPIRFFWKLGRIYFDKFLLDWSVRKKNS